MTDAGGPGRDGRERGDLRIGVVRSYLPGPPPRPTLADSGSKQRAMLPARSVRDHSLGFDAEGWKRFAAGLARVIGRCRDRGYDGWLVVEQDIDLSQPGHADPFEGAVRARAYLGSKL